MSDRLEFHKLLLSIGCSNVYYQIPSNQVIKYPCIKYTINRIQNKHADNSVYKQDVSYTVTVMSKDADCSIVDDISRLPRCSFDRRYVQDNIYHTVFNLYY